MDRGKYGCWTLNLFIFVMLFSVPEAFADDLEKLLLELPQVEIIGKKDLDQRFVKEDIKPDDFKLDNVETESKKEDSNILVSSAYGQFNSKIFDLKQSLRTEQMYYSTELSISDSDGERDNSQFTSYRPRFSFELPVNKENEFIFDMNYFDKAMGLPGPVDAQTPASKRRNTSTKISSTLKHRQDDVCLTFTPYYWFSVLNDTAGPGYKDKLLGARGGVEYNENSLNIDIYQDRLDKNYERLRMLANFRLAALDLTDQWQLILGTDIFAEEEFGQRPAPFAEFVFRNEEDNILHKFTLERQFKPVIFSDIYLDENYIEVNPAALRPRRQFRISYQMDKYVSPEWRTNLMLYARQDKDAWFFQDEDNDGLYSPFFFEKVNYLGVKLSTEYTWSKTFSHFFSLNIRKIRSKDANYEFVPYEPKQKISLGLAYKITDNCKLDVTGDYSGRRFYERNSKDSSTGYFLLGSKITYEAKDYLTFFVLIDNVLNDHYEIVKKYPNQSRSTLGGVLIKF